MRICGGVIHAVIGRRQRDGLRVGDDVSVDLVVLTEGEPIMVRIVAAHMGVHGLGHCVDIAYAHDFPDADAQPWDIAAEAGLPR